SMNIFTSGTITGTDTFAIQFNNGGGNTLTLGPGFVMNGYVAAPNNNDTFQLGGTGAWTFDLSAIGNQYTGFNNFNTISGTWLESTTRGRPGVAGNGRGGSRGQHGTADMTPAKSLSVSGTGILGILGYLTDTFINAGGTLMPGLPNPPGGQLT